MKTLRQKFILTARRAFRLPAGRIALAICLSLLIHAALLFGPTLIQIKPAEVELPPLLAKLEPLPVAKKPPPPKKRAPAKPKPVTPPAPLEKAAEPVAEEVAAPVEEVIAAPVEEEKPAHPLPRHAQLTFIAYKGASFAVGEARYRLDIDDENHYTLQVGMNTTGIASLFKTFELNQKSSGNVSAKGLQPIEFIENKLLASGKQTLNASFDWQNQKLNFSSGNSITLPAHAQDILSFLFQFSQMSLDQTVLDVHVSNGRKLESYQLEVGNEEEIQTRLGKLRVLPLHKIHAPGEEGMDIWLGLEYRLLPVQIRQFDKNGDIIAQMMISDIRVSEE
ncbi:MAG: DUF3108 domain-containing protein [Nitrosomonadales bacterium]